MTTYSTSTIDSFSIGIDQGVTCVLAQGIISNKLKAICNLCFAAYSPVALIINITNRFNISYIIAQEANQVDLVWFLNALSRFEGGWVYENNMLFSPSPSKLSQSQIIETFKTARLTAEACIS